jgi:hypothetical protein
VERAAAILNDAVAALGPIRHQAECAENLELTNSATAAVP